MRHDQVGCAQRKANGGSPFGGTWIGFQGMRGEAARGIF